MPDRDPTCSEKHLSSIYAVSLSFVLNDGQVHAGGGELPVRGGGRHRLHPDLLRPPHPPQDRPHPRPLDQVYYVISLLDS
jgi:hypothetical protein